MSTSPIGSKPNRTPYFIVGGLVGCLLLCVCFAVLAGGAYLLIGRNSPIVVATPIPTLQSNQLPTGLANPPTPIAPNSNAVDYATFNGSGAPFSVQYPSDWDVVDNETDQNTVVFISPSKTASANVTYGKLGTANLQDAFDKILTSVFKDSKVISKTTNPDQSLGAELEHTSPDFGGRVHAYIRLVPVGSTYYIVQFNVVVDEFDQYKEIGKTIIGSLAVSP